MSNGIAALRRSLKNDIKKYDDAFETIMASNVPLVDTVSKFIVKHKGKGLRPLLVLLSARLCGEPGKATYIVASVIELLHTATLVHDDVVDNADVRRSFPSINAIWKNKISVLMGDYLLSKSLIGATETGQIKVMQVLADTAKRLSQGELLQIEKSRKLNITEDDYYKMVSDKTAALISASCELGAMSSTDDEKKIAVMRDFGENLGIAFQIKDDLLDYTGKQTIIGKPVGADLKEKKITLPLIEAFKKAPQKEKKKIRLLLKKGASDKDVQTIIAFCERYDGIRSAENIAREFANKAKSALDTIESNGFSEGAHQFVDYVINRTK